MSNQDKPKLNPIEIIETSSRLALYQLQPSDAHELYELINNSRDHLSQHGDTTSLMYPTYESVLESISSPPNPNRIRFGIRVKNRNKLIGSINITPTYEFWIRRAEIGYYLGHEYIGHGYMTEAINILTMYAFNKLNLQEVFAYADLENTASIRTLQKAGFEIYHDSFDPDCIVKLVRKKKNDTNAP